MVKEPWEEDIYEGEEMNLKRTSKKTVVWANKLLTILAIIFVIIVLGIGATLFYLSSGGTSSKNVTEGFYSTESVAAPTESTPAPEGVAGEQTDEASTTEESSTVPSGPGTIAVLAGEGEAAIAARAGISIAQLETLNPEHMTRGYWYANPGDVVKTQ